MTNDSTQIFDPTPYVRARDEALSLLRDQLDAEREAFVRGRDEGSALGKECADRAEAALRKERQNLNEITLKMDELQARIKRARSILVGFSLNQAASPELCVASALANVVLRELSSPEEG